MLNNVYSTDFLNYLPMTAADKQFIEMLFASQEKLINTKFEGQEKLTNDRFNHVIEKQEETIAHQKVTNGRVTKLEDRMDCMNWLTRATQHPIKTVLIILAAVFIVTSLAGMITFKDIVSLIKLF